MILVDECRWPFRGRLWCHLVSDVSYDELHLFARVLGVPRVAFQGDHYDLHEDDRRLAIVDGARAVDSRFLVRAITSGGLRRGPALTRGGLAAVRNLAAPTLTTERLALRQWRVADTVPASKIESDPTIMKFLGGVRSTEATTQLINANSVTLAIRGFGTWAVERRDTHEFVGIVGLTGTVDLPTHPAIEVTFRLNRSAWGNGFAREATLAALHYGAEELDLNHIFASTSRKNTQSIAVLEQLGFFAGDEFDHPNWAVNDHFRRHTLFKWSAGIESV